MMAKHRRDTREASEITTRGRTGYLRQWNQSIAFRDRRDNEVLNQLPAWGKFGCKVSF